MTYERQQTGSRGEAIAAVALEARGYRVLARRYRTRAGEIDLVAQDGDTIVFVEVKARRSGEFGDPVEAVTRLKQHRVVAMAADYLARAGLAERPVRFDVVGVVMDGEASSVEVHVDAFRPGW
jgi:putative endonuclease